MRREREGSPGGACGRMRRGPRPSGALRSLLSPLDGLTALASLVAAELAVALCWTGVMFSFRDWSKVLTADDIVGYVYLTLALLALFAPLAVGLRRGRPGSCVGLTWGACTLASVTLLGILAFVHVPDANIDPFWFISAPSFLLAAATDALLSLVLPGWLA